jgi:hypothetical protein
VSRFVLVCHPVFSPEYNVHMANPKHTIHVGIAVVGLVVGAIMAIATGGDAFALGLATGGTTGIGYWLGGAAQRRHG